VIWNQRGAGTGPLWPLIVAVSVGNRLAAIPATLSDSAGRPLEDLDAQAS